MSSRYVAYTTPSFNTNNIVLCSAERKYEGTDGIAAFVGMWYVGTAFEVDRL